MQGSTRYMTYAATATECDKKAKKVCRLLNF